LPGDSFASPETGTPPHLVGESFRLSLRLDLALAHSAVRLDDSLDAGV
jgi:hypothetical protein